MKKKIKWCMYTSVALLMLVLLFTGWGTKSSYAEETNVALGKSTSASSTYPNYRYKPGNAVDGNMGTIWCSAETQSSSWITVDLGAMHEVSKINFNTGIQTQYVSGYKATKFTFQSSENGTDFTDRHQGTLEANGVQETYVGNVTTFTARYVRIWVSEYQRGTLLDNFRISEIEIYGTKIKSTNAELSNLVLSNLSLSPSFSSSTLDYTVTVPYSVQSVVAKPTSSDSYATVKVNGETVTRGNSSTAIPLNVGTNMISVNVTAEDGIATKAYTITVTRLEPSSNADLSALSLSSGTLDPVFARDTTSYTATVPYSVSSVTAKPSAAESHATLKVNGSTVTSGSASGAVSLDVGDNIVTVEVAAEDGTTTKTYTITVTRFERSSDADLSALSLSSGNLNPAFSSEKTSYTASVANNVNSLTVTPTVSESHATVKVNGSTVTSGSASEAVNLDVGDNTVTVEVTAEDGTTTKSYTVIISRAAASSGGPSAGGSGGAVSSPVPTTVPTPSTQQTVLVTVNGTAQQAAKETKVTEAGKSTIIVNIDNTMIEKMLDTVSQEQPSRTNNLLGIQAADQKAEVANFELTGDMVKKLEDHHFDVSVKQGDMEYVIPAAELAIDKAAANLGITIANLQDITVEISVKKPDEAKEVQFNHVLTDRGAKQVLPPVSFGVVARTTKKDGSIAEVSIDRFGSYVARVIQLPEGTTFDRVTTGVVLDTDGSYSSVPTEQIQIKEKKYVKINSLTNSEYAVIYSPLRVQSVEKHWSKEVVNDLASRLVIVNPETFEPNQSITRADFAEYIVRALGLYRASSDSVSGFSDVRETGNQSQAIRIASEMNLVNGYPDGTFRPEANLTREEAMTMYERAMKVTQLTGTDIARYEKYSDFVQVSSWARSSVQNVLAAHVFSGTGAETISPKAHLTYAQAAQAIKNLLVESKLMNE